ncbi:MAG: thiol-activated cytolysin family protein [Kofleriaceae bacterium]
MPGVPAVDDRANLDARAQALGVSPLIAGVPNIESYLDHPSFTAYAFPTGMTTTQQFMNTLFGSGIWANTQPGQSESPLAPDANGCQLKRVDATYNPEEFVSFDAGAGLLYPSSLAQGAYVNLGVGALTPLHVPYTQRNPVQLVSTFYSSATAPTATSTDVYGSIGTMIQNAQASGGVTQSTVFFDMKSASSLEEAAAKFKLDTKLFGGTIGATFSSANSTQTNTVFVRFTQSLFTVFQDLRGFTPTAGEFNSLLTVADLENLGNTGELAYNNLPTYIRAVTYGRMLIFSVTSNTSKSELEEAVNAVYGKTSVSASASQKQVVQDSQLRVFSYGGPSEPAIATIKSGNWQDYFTLVNVPLATLKPLGYEVRRLDDQLATMSRTTSYTERTCPGVHKISVRMSDVYKKATLSVQTTGSTQYDTITETESFKEVQINSFLVGGDDQIRIAIQVGQPGFLRSYQSHMRLEIFVDGVKVSDPGAEWYECTYCHSKDPVWVYRVNQFTGEVTRLYGP